MELLVFQPARPRKSEKGVAYLTKNHRSGRVERLASSFTSHHIAPKVDRDCVVRRPIYGIPFVR